MPQFHVHMMPAAGFMPDGYAAIPLLGFAPFGAQGHFGGQGPFAMPRRRYAVARRPAGAAVPVLRQQAAAGGAGAPPQAHQPMDGAPPPPPAFDPIPAFHHHQIDHFIAGGGAEAMPDAVLNAAIDAGVAAARQLVGPPPAAGEPVRQGAIRVRVMLAPPGGEQQPPVVVGGAAGDAAADAAGPPPAAAPRAALNAAWQGMEDALAMNNNMRDLFEEQLFGPRDEAAFRPADAPEDEVCNYYYYCYLFILHIVPDATKLENYCSSAFELFLSLF